MPAQGYRRMSLINAVWTAHSAWRGLTPKQRAAVLDPKAPMSAVVRRNLREKHMLRADGRLTKHAEQVLRFRPRA